MRNRISKLFIATTLAFTLVGCSDDFLAEKRPYGNFSYAEVYSDWASVKLRLNYIYQKSLPYAKGYNSNAGAQTDNMVPDQWPVGYPDFLSANTEEFEGYGLYTDPASIWTYSNIHKYFYYGINESPWKKMRECTDVIYYLRLVDSPKLTEEQKNQVESQARFFRATRYFRLWKRYGGLPIVRTLQSTAISDRDSLSISRQSTKDTYDFMIQDLTYAGENLPARWEEEVNDWGRITSGCAYALAGQIANYYASPVFNRADDASRWQQAYDLNKKALEALQAGNFGLAYEGDAGTNASNWAKIWGTMTLGDGNVSEGVFVNICNNTLDEETRYNGWEQQIRPSNCLGSGNVTPTAEMVDLFPMADGKRPAEAGGEYSYNKLLFFLNRDPRFYRTFAFPGVEWKFSGQIKSEKKAESCPYLSGENYRLNSFAWYSSVENAADSVRSGFYDDKLGDKGKSIYVRKRSQDQSLGQTPLYTYDENNGFDINGQPLLITRYTEVLLNFAEAACGVGKLDEAWDALVKIRQRVGYTGDCGLDAAIRSDRARMFEAILYERQIELAYEGKRFDDCHRWMLFDGGVDQGSINNTWALTGWNGNTCQYLGVTPLNELRLHRLEIMFDPDGLIGMESSEFNPTGELGEPFPAALTLKEDFRTVYDEASATYSYNDKAVQAWANYYMANMKRKDIATMTAENKETMEFLNPHWQENLYFMGLQSSDQENNPGVVQTIGWQSRFGGMGVFDPLSENPVTDINSESGSK